MERYEMAELLSKKAGVSLEEARAALEENNWDMLDAMVALERANKTAGEAVHADTADSGGEAGVKPVKNVSAHKDPGFFSNGFAVLWEYVKKFFRITLDNDFVVERRGKRLLGMPVLVLLVLLVLSAGLVLVALIVGLFCDCRYRLEGRQLGKDGINDAMGKMSDLAGDIKQSIQNAADRNGQDRQDP